MAVTGTTLGRFRLERELGSGGHGSVWSAVDTLLGDRVALKILHADLVGSDDAKQRLKREVVLARRVQHRGICRVNDLHEIDDTLVISMQLAPGRDLDTLIDGVPLSPTRALRIIDRIADAVAAAHAENVIHRDLKPSNINVDDDDQIVVLDFGIASAGDLGRLTEPGVVIGTLRFVAPEVLETAHADARSDLYAIAVIGWGLLAGKLPWGRPSSAIELINALEKGPPDLRAENPAVPVAVANVIHQAMSKDPDDRYADVASFQRALAIAASSIASSPVPAAAAPRAAATQIVRQRQRTREFSPTTETFTISKVKAKPSSSSSSSRNALLAVAGAVGACVVVGAVVALALWQQRSPEPVIVAAPVAAVVVPAAVVVEAPAEPVVAAVEVAAPTSSSSSTTKQNPLERELAAAHARARTLGLRRGDVPAWDASSSSATEALRKAPTSPATAEAVKRAQQVVGAVVVDHAFVTGKLRRFNADVDAAIRRNPAMKDKVTPAATAVARAMSSNDSAATNRALNAAFAVLERR